MAGLPLALNVSVTGLAPIRVPQRGCSQATGCREVMGGSRAATYLLPRNADEALRAWDALETTYRDRSEARSTQVEGPKFLPSTALTATTGKERARTWDPWFPCCPGGPGSPGGPWGESEEQSWCWGVSGVDTNDPGSVTRARAPRAKHIPRCLWPRELRHFPWPPVREKQDHD